MACGHFRVVATLNALMAKTMSMTVSEELTDLYELMVDPDRMVRSAFSQRWDEDGTVTKWSIETTKGLLDLQITYDDNSTCYMAPEEIIVDILCNDLELFTD